MIRGTTAPFKYEMPEAMDDYCVIEAIFWQPGNDGTTQAPLPIIMIYDRRYTDAESAPIDTTNFDIAKVYKYNNQYYTYNGTAWVHSNDQPIRNDGLHTSANNSKEIVVTLTAEQTLRFRDTSKAYTQIIAYHGDTVNATVASRRKRFTVYPIYGDLNLGETTLSVLDSSPRG